MRIFQVVKEESLTYSSSDMASVVSSGAHMGGSEQEETTVKSSPDTHVQKIANIIYNDCKPYTSANPDFLNLVMYRGTEQDFGNYSIRKQRADRKPRDTNKFVHDVMGRMFEDKFGINFRANSMHATGSETEALEYMHVLDGSMYVTLPIGNFNYCWSPKVSDMVISLDPKHSIDNWSNSSVLTRRYIKRAADQINPHNAPAGYESIRQATDNYIRKQMLQTESEEHETKALEILANNLKDLFDDAEYTTTGLRSAIKSMHEIMINCKEYLLIETHYFNSIKPQIQQELNKLNGK